MHVKCGDLPLTTETVKWKCNDCLETMKKMPKRTKHYFKRIQLNKKFDGKSYENIPENTQIIVSYHSESIGEPSSSKATVTKATFNVADKGFSASFNLCPKVCYRATFKRGEG